MSKQNKNHIEFHYGILNNKLEEQANNQGCTLGSKAKHLEKHCNQIYDLWIDNLLTSREKDKLIRRLNKRVIKSIQRIGGNENDV